METNDSGRRWSGGKNVELWEIAVLAVAIAGIVYFALTYNSSPGSMTLRGLSYLSSEDYEEAVECLRAGAEGGNTLAMNELGNCYANGRGVERDYAEAAKWYKLALENGDSTMVLCNLAELYAAGKGVERDGQEALRLYGKAIERGETRAYANLAWCYEYGEGVEADRGKALELYRVSAEEDYGYADWRIGDILYDSLVGAKYLPSWTEDSLRDVIAKHYKRAIKNGEPRANYSYAKHCMKVGNEQISYYKEAAKAEFGDAMFELGELYYKYDIGVEREEKVAEAFKWYSKAAEEGSLDGTYMLGVCYMVGIGTMADEVKGIENLSVAVKHSSSRAQYALGVCYEAGRGVDRDTVEARRLYSLAADNGSYQAKLALKKLGRDPADEVWEHFKAIWL